MNTYSYKVARLPNATVVDAKWNKAQWQSVEPLTLSNFMGDKPEHFPKVQAKVAYHGHDIAAIFRVEDRYVRAVETSNHGRIWEDSCVELFVTPSSDIKTGFFNIEMNCCGKFLCCHQLTRGVDVRPMQDKDMSKFNVAHTLNGPLQEEIAEPVIWCVEYTFPAEILSAYSSATMPAPGVVWRANFYKCADLCSHPHWLTWTQVDNPTPNFHLPQFFGELVFE